MATPVEIKDGGGSGTRALVSIYGQLIVAPFDYDGSAFQKLDATGTAFSFFPPIASRRFVITGMRIKASRNVSNTVDADVIVFEADGPASTVVVKVLHQELLIRGESTALLPLNLLVSEGMFINATTTDADVTITIFGYYIPK